jgi:ribosomal protein L7Ae-like RNA K-turn-binding protein
VQRYEKVLKYANKNTKIIYGLEEEACSLLCAKKRNMLIKKGTSKKIQAIREMAIK